MDGYVTIGTSLDSKGLEKDLRDAERQLRQYEKEAEKLTKQKVKIEADVSDFEAAKTLIQQQTDETLKNAQTQEQVNFVLEQEADNLKVINAAYDVSKGELDEINRKIRENSTNQENVKTEIDGINTNLIKVKKNNDLKDMFDDMGDSAKKVTKRIAAWGLAIIGIRSVYNGIRNAISVISQQDEQLAADIEYMKNALAYALEPIVRVIVNLMKQLMLYVGYIVREWTGTNIFENANKSLKGANKQAKELIKTMAGFDEMNVLSDTSGGGDSAGAMPSFDLSNLDDVPIPSWLQWIVDHKDEVIAGLLGIAGGLVALKLGLDPLMALGIGLALAGVVYAIEGILEYLQDPTWQNFGKIIQGIGIAVVGLGILFLGLPGIIAGAIILVVGTIIKYWDEIKGFLSTGIEWLQNSVSKVRDFMGDQVANIYQTFVDMFKGILIGFNNAINGLKQILDGIIQFVGGVFTGNWKQAWEGLKNIFSGAFNTMKGVAFSVLSTISGAAKMIVQTVAYTIGDLFKGVINVVLALIESKLNTPINAINKLISKINDVPGINIGKLSTIKLPRLAKGGIINMPGRGVPIGSAIGGERGQEGVIPLTDSQQMAMLGEMIGRYVNINATIPVYVGNRQIARELRKINAEDDFAFNG